MSVFIISEIGINHNGDINLAKKMIEESVISGADAVKFQKRDINIVYSKEMLSQPRESSWGTTQRDQKEGLEFGKEEYEEIDKRQFVRYMILILCNTGIRIGECRQLKWKDIKVEPEKDGSLSSIINIRISKTGPRKGVVGRRGEYFKKIKEFSNYRSGEDYVFVENTTGEPIGDKTIYRLWDEMIDNTSLKDTSEEYSYYCLRHTYATIRIRS